MSMRQWYLAVGSRRLGPYTSEQIPQLVRDGTLRHQTYVWNDDMEGWATARDVPEIASSLRGVPEDAAHPPAAVSADVLSKLVDQVTADVTAEVMGHFGSYTQEAALSDSGKHLAVQGKPAASRTPGSAAKEAPAAPAGPRPVAPAAKAEAPARPAAPAPAPAPVRPAEPAVKAPVSAVPAYAASPRPPEPAEKGPAAVPTPPAPGPFGAMPPDPFISTTRLGGVGPASSGNAARGILKLLGWSCKGLGFVGTVFGAVALIRFVGAAVSFAAGPADFVGRVSLGLMPLSIGLGVLAMGFLIDLWLAQADQVKAVLDVVRKKSGGT